MKNVIALLLALVLCVSLGGCGAETPAADETVYQNVRLPILMYHHIVPDGTECTDMTVTVSRLEEDLQWLADNGYTTVLPRELAAGDPLPEKPVLITFDDGYYSNYSRAYPLLQKYQAKAVISVIVYMPDNLASEYLSWELCREMADSGLVEIGSHTYQLHNLDERNGSYTAGEANGIQRKDGETDGEFQTRVLDDIQKSYDLIEENVGTAPTFFTYPYGLIEADAEELIRSLFPVTAVTGADIYPADLSDGLWDLTRFSVTMSADVRTLLAPSLTKRFKFTIKEFLGI